jgi:SAM-dependent methyltransferase
VTFSNVYDDHERASAYATLEFPGTYALAYRDLPAIIGEHVSGRTALDFGCGTGRSSRFLERLGFEVIGIDISASMIEQARKSDPDGTYIVVAPGDFTPVADRRFDLVASIFPFDNIPGIDTRRALMRGLRDLLNPEGRLVLLGSTPDVYTHEWASFSTAAFAENRTAKSGDTARVLMKDVLDARPVVDVVWMHEDYVDLFASAGLSIVAEYRPLGRDDEGFAWVSETRVAPWVIYVTAV